MSTQTTTLIIALRSAGDPHRAKGQQAYLKLDIPCAGVRVPEVRRMTRGWLRTFDPPLGHDPETMWGIVDELWEVELFESKLAAVEILSAPRMTFSLPDLKKIQRLVRSADTWALVDPLATQVVWSIIVDTRDRAHPRTRQDAVDTLWAWLSDDTMWVRRAAVLSQLRILRAPAGDARLFYSFADSLIEEKEFFIAKALGWCLRERSKRQPHEVLTWLEAHIHEVQPVTFREGSKYLPRSARDSLTSQR